MSYTFAPVGMADNLGELSRLLISSFPDAEKYRSEAFLHWQYRDNPLGLAVGTNVFSGTSLAAHYVTLPMRAWFDGQERRGLLSLNTATHPKHQGRGLFTQLAERTYALGADQGFEFVVGVANANSTPGFLRKLGFQLVAPLDVRVGLGRVRSTSRDQECQFAGIWDADFLTWRLANPVVRYAAKREGALTDIFSRTHIPGIKAALGSVASNAVTETASLRRALQPLTLWIGLDTQRLQSGLLHELPERFKASPLNLIFRDLRGTRSLRAEDCAFRLLDFDAY